MGKLVLITGASSGLGQAMALRFYRAGYAIALVSRRTDVMQQWAQAQQLDPLRYAVYAADVREEQSMIDAALACRTTQGLPDIVIANAGIFASMDSRVRADLGVMRDVYATNVFGLAATFHPFIEAMLQRGSGQLVGIASVAAIRGLPRNGAYCSSKAAAISYCESTRCDLRGRGVLVQTIVPGYVHTPMSARGRFPMPFVLSAAAFADRAFVAITSGKHYCVIPWQMRWIARLLRVLPNWLFYRLFASRRSPH